MGLGWRLQLVLIKFNICRTMFIVPVPSQESERLCMYLLGVSFSLILYFPSSYLYHLNSICLLYFRAVLAVWYF